MKMKFIPSNVFNFVDFFFMCLSVCIVAAASKFQDQSVWFDYRQRKKAAVKPSVKNKRNFNSAFWFGVCNSFHDCLYLAVVLTERRVEKRDTNRGGEVEREM